MIKHNPTTPSEIAELVSAAAADGSRLAIRGHGTKAGAGAPSPAAVIVDVSGIAGVVDYDPAELVLTVRPGTPLAEVEAMLATKGQMLAFDPFDLARGQAKGATVGGMIAAGLAGSRRLTRGSVRDHLLGFTAVSGRGEIFEAGGKVVKNVTGYDLSKLMCGSWGRLAVMTEVTLKVLPAPEIEKTFAIAGLTPEAARKTMAAALGSQADVAAAAYLPGLSDAVSQTLLRLEGIAPSIAARIPILARAVNGCDIADVANGAARWTEIARLSALAGADRLWRIVLPARELPALAEMMERQDAKWLADWAGGLVWTDWPGDAELLRDHLTRVGGHATLLRADEETRSRVPMLQPQGAGITKLEERVRRAFDPAGVFETERFGNDHAN
jgi:glycolate oxidase FAD binding subunit